ncbi:homospermidine synthase [Rhodoplanes sp. Z2-YC6860]|uniref:homospermidine synthase n=1 Tax=Rhodoplanes sp. Z2-YC6860 TaxID=674703 RepID=UPI00078C31C3|nr:saccharopine dehydrogenase C-terminal domain-containing protein [Rhodoplanes sp. Z2-YC6860]AMN39819.1 Homospermidine synthase [Rhodoplanes sp. Z2-YC6860]
MTDTKIRFDGPIVMIGLGSIGRGFLPLLERHIAFDRSKFVCIDPVDTDRRLLDERKLKFMKVGLTKANHREVLTPLLNTGPGRGMIVNVSVDTSSVDIMDLCHDLNCFYIDTVAEPWLGFYDDPKLTLSQRSNYALRERVLDLRKRKPGGVTMVNCCGANPGMVSWFVKEALLNVARDTGIKTDVPKTREEWAALMQRVGVKGIHVAERDTQRARDPKPRNKFVNTWSVEGFVSEGLQPAELGYGTHEKGLPPNGFRHDFGSGAGIYLAQAGAGTKVRTWTPTAKAQHGFLVTHNEAISIPDYFTVREGDKVVYRPTCHYAYHPCDDAILSLHEMAGNAWARQPTWKILDETEIVDGVDELGVLLYGHAKNAYWYGSRLSIEQARKLAPYQNATGLQVTSAVLAGIFWMLENPDRGIMEADEVDFKRCLEVQRPYLGEVFGEYTDWTPLAGRPGLFAEELDTSDPWQFTNVLVR